MNPPSYKQPAGRFARSWRHILLVVLLAAVSAPAMAQAPGSAPLTTGEVKIELESFGVGNVARVGEWCGVRLKVTDTGTKSRELIIRLAGLDFDGDTPLYQREIASNPGSAMSVWMYLRLPFSYNPSTGVTAYAYESSEGDAPGEGPAGGRRAGRLLGFADLRSTTGPSGVVREATQGMIAVVGPQARPLGLTDYSASSGGAGLTRSTNPNAHEITNIVMGLSPAAMPDRWHGLLPFDAVVWAQGDPVNLDEPRSNALREYVEHGGHLVIVLPSINQTWTDPRSNKLLDVMPMVTLAQKEVDDFDRYRPLLSRQPLPSAAASAPLFPRQMSLYTFTPRPDANPSEAVRVLNGPDGECVVVRRLVGAGAITLVGLDLNHTALSQFELIDADMFWHRILGRRGDYSPRQPQQGTGVFSRRQWVLDENLNAEIAKQRSAAAGVLVGFVVFVVYWLVAAPVGFFVLKRYNKTHHSWVAFVASAGLFTAISWTGAKLMRESEVAGTHLTILDHIYGQPLQRAKVWSSISIPWYGTATVSVGEQDTGAGPGINNLIASWDPPAGDNAAWGGFPDVRGYVVDTRRPDSIRVPVRSTVKQVEAVWAGGPRWEMPRPLRPEEGGEGGLTLLDNRPRPDGVRGPSADGTLVHNMPAPIDDAIVVIVRRQRSLARYSSTFPIAVGEVFPIGYPWQPGTPLDLSTVTAAMARPTDSDLNAVLNNRFRLAEGSVASTDLNRRFQALAFFNQLPPSEPGSENVAAQRVATHGWDLGHWFTQPCIMILGTVGGEREKTPSPVPLLVDGEPVPNAGRTVVRWIYPLPDDPPSFPGGDAQPSDTPADPRPDE